MEFILGLAIGAAAGFYFHKFVWAKLNAWLDEGGA